MHTGSIFLSQATDAIDVALITKDTAVRRYAADHALDLSRVAAIGDSEPDLPFLTLPGLALAGCPANSQPRVKDTLAALPHGRIMPGDVFDGFEAFYDECADRGVRLIFSDKDGVLASHDITPSQPRLVSLFSRMGLPSRPFVIVLTGSGEAQNIDFLAALRHDAAFAANPTVLGHPTMLLAECGALQMNVLTGEASIAPWINMADAEWVPALRETVRHRVERDVLPAFGLTWSTHRDDQNSKLFMAQKRTMVTINIPRTHAGEQHYRRAAASDALRQALLNVVAAAAHDIGVGCTRV